MTRDITIIRRELDWCVGYRRKLQNENALLTTALTLIQADELDAIRRETALRFCEQEADNGS